MNELMKQQQENEMHISGKGTLVLPSPSPHMRKTTILPVSAMLEKKIDQQNNHPSEIIMGK